MKRLMLALALLVVTPALAHDWTGLHDPQIAAFFQNLHRKADNFPCCGPADAYPIRILREADPSHPDDETGEAEIADGSEVEIDDAHNKRTSILDGTRFKFAFNRLTKESDGNPTRTAWAFLNVDEKTHRLQGVWCVVPLPPSM